MKRVFHRMTALVMAFVVMFSTMSFTISMHYCGDTLVETAVFQKAEGCGMDMDNTVSDTCSITKKNCCDDKQLLIEGQDELQLSSEDVSLEQQLFVTLLVNTINNLFEGVGDYEIPLDDYSPPLVERDIQVLYQVYLI